MIDPSTLGEFAAIIGPDHVTTTSLDQADPFGFGHSHTPAAILRPGSVAQVQAVLRVASQRRIPLWTVSRGRNFGDLYT